MIIPSHHKKSFLTVFALKRFSRAFTLVEILLVVSLFAMTSIAIFQTFSSGVRIWDYASKFFPEEDVMLSLEQMTHDLHNSFYYSLFEFKGELATAEFTTIVTTPSDPRSGSVSPYLQQIGRVQYSFDKNKKQILRKQADYGQATDKKWQEPKVFANGVTQLKFTYLFRSKNRLVERPVTKGVMPAMVRVEIDYQAEKDIRHMMRVIDLPSSLAELE